MADRYRLDEAGGGALGLKDGEAWIADALCFGVPEPLRELVRLANLGAEMEAHCESVNRYLFSKGLCIGQVPAGGLTSHGVETRYDPVTLNTLPPPPAAHEEVRLEDDGAPPAHGLPEPGAPYPGSWRDKPSLL
jgi:hypothetical protein